MDVGREFVGNTELLGKIRRYISVVKQLEYDLSDEMQKSVQEDFVEERRRQQGQVSVVMLCDNATFIPSFSVTFFFECA